ncbi:hypothetical protein B0H34DRAFT_678090 [Crassisporium funariophilum]|nr:hypothetical protein B0H34DRAFT_678090 [Crassisporium funariophilum]
MANAVQRQLTTYRRQLSGWQYDNEGKGNCGENIWDEMKRASRNEEVNGNCGENIWDEMKRERRNEEVKSVVEIARWDLFGIPKHVCDSFKLLDNALALFCNAMNIYVD